MVPKIKNIISKFTIVRGLFVYKFHTSIQIYFGWIYYVIGASIYFSDMV